MATFNVFTDLIVPVGERLQREPRFAGINIFYDRSDDRLVPRENTPAINYFLEAPWEDLMRGSGSFSVNNRRMVARLGFGIWVYGGSTAAQTDQVLFGISGDLFDFFRERRDFNRTRGISIKDEIRWDVDYSGDETNIFLATQKLSVEFEFFSGC